MTFEAIYNDYRKRCTDGSDIHQHLPTLYDAVESRPGAQVLEFGVRSGNSTAAFLPAAMKTGGFITSVDISPPSVNYDLWNGTGCWKVLVGDDLSPIIQADTPQEVDVLFIDTSHAYDHTLAELRTYVPRVRSGGIVLMHDTELKWPEGIGPMYDPVGDAFPVARALDTYCSEVGTEWQNMTGCWGLGIINIA